MKLSWATWSARGWGKTSPDRRRSAPACRVSVGATTVNKVCGSGMKAVMLAAQAIQCGDARTVVAGGTESMSGAPYLLAKARSGYRMGNGELIDAVIRDGLWDVYNGLHMGTFGDRCAAKENITRQEQDDFAVASYQRAIAAQKDNTFAAEIVEVEIKGQQGIDLRQGGRVARPLQRREAAGPARRPSIRPAA